MLSNRNAMHVEFCPAHDTTQISGKRPMVRYVFFREARCKPIASAWSLSRTSSLLALRKEKLAAR